MNFITFIVSGENRSNLGIKEEMNRKIATTITSRGSLAITNALGKIFSIIYAPNATKAPAMLRIARGRRGTPPPWGIIRARQRNPTIKEEQKVKREESIMHEKLNDPPIAPVALYRVIIDQKKMNKNSNPSTPLTRLKGVSPFEKKNRTPPPTTPDIKPAMD
jgi:hypothetical protein